MTRLPTTAVESADLAVFAGAVQQVANEMDVTLQRCAFSPVISESIDRASGIYDSKTGGVIAQGRTGLPIFVGVMEATVAAFLSQGREFHPGDVYIINDPYQGGTHLMDVRLVAPFYWEGELRFFLANSAHWADIGGAVAGGFGPAAQSVHAEGLRIGGVKIVDGGGIVNDVKRLILDNVRAPWEREGDLLAQLSAVDTGRRRLEELMQRYGSLSMTTLCNELASYSDGLMRSHLASIPDGRYESVGYLDDDGIGWDPLEIHCAVDISGDSAVIDMAGTSAASKGPLNASKGTAISAVRIGLMHLFPDVPINFGSFRPVSIHVPKGSMLDAQYPVATAGSPAEVATRVIDTVLLAFGQARPDLAQGAPFSTSANVAIHGRYNGEEYIMYYFAGGGYGGSADGDGLSNACPAGSMAKVEPVEVLEAKYPILFDHFKLRVDSGGVGQYRGGLGIEYEFEFRADEGSLSFLMDRGKYGPPGVNGGGDGARTTVEVKRSNGDVYAPPHLTKDQGVPLRYGDRVCVATPGGGGYGPPNKRSMDLRRLDTQAGYVLPDAEDARFIAVKSEVTE